MKLIVGLGNPGAEYKNSRHSTGFAVLDQLAGDYDSAWQAKSKLSGTIAQPTIDARPVILLKPQTFYNDSGLSVRLVKDFFKIDDKNILVIHDELALPFGVIRTRQEGSDAGNNGVKSIIAHQGDGFARVRVGIEQIDRTSSDTSFVLGAFNKTEHEQFGQIQKIVAQVIHDFVADTFVSTSYQINVDT